jgi:hypothetical protein
LKRVISAWGLYYFPLCVATPRPDRHNHVMGRDRSEQTSPDLFSTDAVQDASTPPPPATKDATTQPEPQRHVLPKNLRNAVKHLNDEELDLLHAATLEEKKRRGRLQPNVEADSAQTSHHTKRSPIKDKISEPRRVAETTLTLGQINAVRAAFRAGITPARIARQFGISQSNVRKALATDEAA